MGGKWTMDDSSDDDVPSVVGRYDEFFDRLDETERKMSRERIRSLVLAENDGLKISYTGKTYLGDHMMIIDFIPGSGRVEEVSPYALSKGLTKILGESFSLQSAVDHTQATLDTYLTAPPPNPLKGFVRKAIDYVVSRF